MARPLFSCLLACCCLCFQNTANLSALLGALKLNASGCSVNRLPRSLVSPQCLSYHLPIQPIRCLSLPSAPPLATARVPAGDQTLLTPGTPRSCFPILSGRKRPRERQCGSRDGPKGVAGETGTQVSRLSRTGEGGGETNNNCQVPDLRQACEVGWSNGGGCCGVRVHPSGWPGPFQVQNQEHHIQVLPPLRDAAGLQEGQKANPTSKGGP